MNKNIFLSIVGFFIFFLILVNFRLYTIDDVEFKHLKQEVAELYSKIKTLEHTNELQTKHIELQNKQILEQDKEIRELSQEDLENKNAKLPTFYELGIKHGTDKVTKHKYHFAYDKYLPLFRRKKTKLLEIGLGCNMRYGPGASYHVWREYFSNVEIHFIEIDKNCSEKWQSKIYGNIHVGSQDNVNFLYEIMDSTGANYDIIIDDGSHANFHQILSFSVLFPFVRPGGLYIVEDLLTSYWPWFGSAQNFPYSMMEFIKTLMDGLNRVVDVAESGHVQVDYFLSYYIHSIHCFEKICIFERNDNLTLPERKPKSYYENNYIKPEYGIRSREVFYNRYKLHYDNLIKQGKQKEAHYWKEKMDKMQQQIQQIKDNYPFFY